ncbi:MAG TPA: hypothetical protein VMT35_16885 [Ignavibacteriaceae bacterium]|nr:hypothetical protein [Ignavibacteriaceae bacterium]
MSENIYLILENESLKKEFAFRNLDLSQVFTSTTDDLERENRSLKYLLEWVEKYNELADRKKMEVEGYEFPPVGSISPDNDWYLFERWINGLPVRKKYKDQIPQNCTLKNPCDLDDEEIIYGTQELIKALEASGTEIAFNDEVPARLVYEHLLETLDMENELLIEGGWTLDGCTGYCPKCFQRPWCEQGSSSCWNEDEQAGEMFLIDSVKKYVSASPVSLQILQTVSEPKQDSKRDKNNLNISSDNSESDLDDEIPF